MSIVTVASILGMLLGTAGFVMSLLNYLRNRPCVQVHLEWDTKNPKYNELAHKTSRPRIILASSTLAISLATLLGCKPTPPPTPTPKTQQAPAPIRPTTAPPAFKLFHQTKDSFTLVTTPTATDDQISAIVWQLRDAAHTRTFDTLHIPQKVVDARDPMVWFHIYRGPKCAAEKYTTGKLPCGASYNAAGDYTFGGGTNNQWDDGVLLHDENHQTELWNPNAPYVAPH
jgi:hypothetical protein